MKKKYKYDVAFSFLSQDENLAQDIYNYFRDKTECFLYSKRQEEIAGKDGIDTFGSVFAEESRVVVVLYRNGWGKTPYTRIEENAIKSRLLEEGFDFLLVIPLDQPPTVPKYISQNYIWYGIDKYGFQTALSIVESKIKAMGGNIKEISPEDVVELIKEGKEFDIKRSAFLSGIGGRDKAIAEFQRLSEIVENRIKAINDNGLSMRFTNNNRFFVIQHAFFNLRFELTIPYANTLMDSSLIVKLVQLERPPARNVELKNWEYNFDLHPPDTEGWVPIQNRKEIFSSEQLINTILLYFFRQIKSKDESDRFNSY